MEGHASTSVPGHATRRRPHHRRGLAHADGGQHGRRPGGAARRDRAGDARRHGVAGATTRVPSAQLGRPSEPRADRAAGRDRGPVDERPRPCPGHDRGLRASERTHRRWAWCRAARSTSGSRSWPGSRRSRTTVDGGGWSFPTRGRGARAGSDSPGSPADHAGPRRGRPLPTPDRRPEARPGAVPGTGGDGIAVFPDAGGRVLRHGWGGVLARQLLGSFAFGISGIQPWLPRDGRAATSSRSMGRTTPRRSVGAPARDACGSPRRRSLGCCHSFATARR